MSDTAVVITRQSLWQITPVYHSMFGAFSSTTNQTRCGLVWYDEMNNTSRLLMQSISRRQADKFARPCSKCFRGTP